MPVAFCPECKRAFDGDCCFACGYEAPLDIEVDAKEDEMSLDEVVEDALELGFFTSSPTDAGDDDDAPREVIEDLPLSELLDSVANWTDKVRIIGEGLGLEGRFTESRTIIRALEVLTNPQLAIVHGGSAGEGVGTEVEDGDERIRDDSAVVEALDLGELLQGKKRLSSKIGYIAEALNDEGRVGEAEILLRVKAALERLDAAKTDLDRRL